MVFSSTGEDYMATMGRERRKTRHNFTLPDLKWGLQRSLRCMKVQSNGGSISVDQRRRSPSQLDGGADNQNRRLETERWRSEEGIGEYGEKIISDLRTEAERMKESIFRERVVDYEEEDKKEREREVSPPEAPGVAAEVKPWNLRKRRAACKAPVTESGNCDDGAKFMSTLTKKEMEDDYMAMMGHRPPRRPKKRLRTLQKQIDLLHPAFYFTEVTEGIYEVPDAVETRKR
ncbi:hypothetical protein Bca52824_024364 [Brassica carinata]|uniref:Uncharacterized protein n=1 Tax=Brassica carinata TaxID=52824 RepID=A0A8X8AWN3_BRACI|nr:hypothetical protein Bca52824_024364 [Brassica carinata]